MLQAFVSVNYNMADYLPENSPSTKAMDIMDEEFDGAVPNTRIMINHVSVQEVLQAYKEKLANIDGVSDVMWLDDAIDIKTPIEIADKDILDNYYKDDHALFTLSIREGDEVEVTDAIYDLIGE